MISFKKTFCLFWLSFFALLVASGSAMAAIKIGVLAKRGAPHAMQQWGPTGAYLTEKMGEQVTIIPLKFQAIEQSVKDGKVDFFLANSAYFVELEKKYKVKAVSTMINSREGKALKEFGGVILVKKDSPIKELEDLKGKKFMCVNFSSFGGAHMAWRLLLSKGIDPKKDFAAFLEGEKHDNVVLAVKNGVVDAGTVRTDTMERMAAEGKIKMDDFRILNQIKDDFPFVHSTPLYPEWPMAASPSTDSAVAERLKKALMSIPAESSAAKSAKIIGWTEPLDYSSVRDCLREIKFGAFAN